ncbi:AMP-binding protein [Halostagnicola bangensis]
MTQDDIVHEPSEPFIESTNVWAFMQTYDIDNYDELIARTTRDVPGVNASGIDWFWEEIVDYLDIEFYREFDTVRNGTNEPQFTTWYPDGTINIAHNVLDRHAGTDSETQNSIACLWEGEGGNVRRVTYGELHRQANQVANELEARGVGAGDTVGLYMPMVPEVVSILYGCFKVGAIAVPIFSGFGVDATASRIADSECSVLFTADGFYRRGNPVGLKSAADEALEKAGYVEHTIVYKRLGSRTPEIDVEVPWTGETDHWWKESVATRSVNYKTSELEASHTSMLLYSSGTTGMPKGIVHSHAGPLVQAAKEVHFGFDLMADDRFCWVSDIGWMMGPWTLIGTHTFGGTVFMYEGAPDYPQPDRFWEMIDRHELTQFGISPTAIRALREHGDEWLEGHDLSSLRILGSTGEPWDLESWLWFYERVGNEECPIINISGGTEIMGCFLMPMPIQSLKPCSLGGPGLGMDIDIVDSDGKSVKNDNERGFLVARDSCPSMTKSLWAGDDRYGEEYWSTFEDPPLWDHGDWAQRDEDGYWFLHGRADDALNVAGRKVGPAEIESAAMEHDAVNQAVAIGIPDKRTGTAVVLYTIVETKFDESESLRNDIRTLVGEQQGKPFRPNEVVFVNELPKTQSGKIVRRIVEAIHVGENIGDRSSIENPSALDALEEAR